MLFDMKTPKLYGLHADYSRKKGVIILSGGMDSVTMLHLLKAFDNDLTALSFDYGQKHVKELEYARINCERLGIPWKKADISFLADILKSTLLKTGKAIPEGHYEDATMKQTVVPNRNMIFAAIATGLACSTKADFVAMGVHAGDHTIYPDCRPEFVQALGKVIGLADWHSCSFVTPFLLLHKSDILQIGYDCGVDYGLTTTCYNGGAKACGKCGSCQERLEAFEKIGKNDPLPYE